MTPLMSFSRKQTRLSQGLHAPAEALPYGPAAEAGIQYSRGADWVQLGFRHPPWGT